jgi:hypothetical protein
MEGFIKSTEFAGLKQSAAILEVTLRIDDNGFVVIEKFRENSHVVDSFLPVWKPFDKNFWVPVILKKMNIVANQKPEEEK